MSDYHYIVIKDYVCNIYIIYTDAEIVKAPKCHSSKFKENWFKIDVNTNSVFSCEK